MGLKLQNLSRRLEKERRTAKIKQVRDDFSLFAGTNGYESSSYIALLKINEISDASTLSEISGVPKTRIYETLEDLYVAGFINKIEKKIIPVNRSISIRAFSARPFEDVSNIILKTYEDELSTDIKHSESTIALFDSVGNGGRVSVEEMKELLMVYGFTEYQAKAYTRLHVNGKSKATEVANGSLPATKVYGVLEELQEKDFIISEKEPLVKESKRNVYFYEARPIKDVVGKIIDTYKNDIETLKQLREKLAKDIDALTIDDFKF